MNAIEVWDGSKYLRMPGTPGPQSFAHFGSTPPANPEVGQMWVDDEPLLKQWDDDWQYPVLLNGWRDYDPANYGSARYRKMPGGLVVVAGLIAGGTIGNVAAPAFILPNTHWPRWVMTMALPSWNNTDCRLLINYTKGYFQIQTGSSTWVSICCSFVASSEFPS